MKKKHKQLPQFRLGNLGPLMEGYMHSILKYPYLYSYIEYELEVLYVGPGNQKWCLICSLSQEELLDSIPFLW